MSGGLAGEDIDLLPVYARGVTGLGVKIAVSDSGTDFEHEDLVGNQLIGKHRNYSHTNPELWHISLPYVVGNESHGTSTAGLIAATGWNGIGSRGVAPKAKYGAFRFVGNFAGTMDTFLARNLDQTSGDFDIFNYSYGYPQCFFNTEDEIILEAFTHGAATLRNGKGALYVQASGNDYKGDSYFCAGVGAPTMKYFAANTNTSSDLTVPEKVVVGAVNALGVRSSYSTPGSSLWVSAPGGEDGELAPAMIAPDISGCSQGTSRSTFARGTFDEGMAPNLQCHYTNIMNGTSSATPVVSGVIALMLQAKPSLTWRDVKHILAMTADQVDYSVDGSGNLTPEPLAHPLGPAFELDDYVYDFKWIKNAAGIDYSNWYGFGRVNALAAVLMASTYDFPLGNYISTVDSQTGEWWYDSGPVYVTIPDDQANGTPEDSATTLDVKYNYVVETVQIELTVTHTNASELAVILISPSGTPSRLLNINSNIEDTEFPEDMALITNAFYGEPSVGQWKLKLVDGSDIDSVPGTLKHWKLKINGRIYQGDGTNPEPVSNISLFSPYPSGGSNSYTPPATFTPSSSSDILRYELSVGTAPGLTDVAPWTTIGMNINPAQLGGIHLGPRGRYYLNVRVVDFQENYSAAVSKFFETL